MTTNVKYFLKTTNDDYLYTYHAYRLLLYSEIDESDANSGYIIRAGNYKAVKMINDKRECR